MIMQTILRRGRTAIRFFSGVVGVLAAFLPHVLAADDTLLGSWGGVRPALEEHGVTLEAVLTADVLHNSKGGAFHAARIRCLIPTSPLRLTPRKQRCGRGVPFLCTS